MIHSCAGGVVREKRIFDFVKVKICDTDEVRWFVTEIPLVQVGDIVYVPYGKENIQKQAIVLRIDKSVSKQVSPVPIKSVKKVISICQKK